MRNKKIYIVFGLIGGLVLAGFVGKKRNKKPNIVLIYVDDLGYGDVGYNGAKGVKTPNIDKLAQNGLTFTDGHCTASICTPSRYSLLTGEYAFRNKKARILPGNAPLLIDTKQTTLASMLKKAGYITGVVGKWHLGLGNGTLNWNSDIKPGPNEIGFDYSYLIPATGDRVPCVFVENNRIINLDKNDPIEVNYKRKIGSGPTGKENPEFLTKMVHSHGHDDSIINGIGRIGYMTGGDSAKWKDEDFADILTNKAKNFISSNKENPFFLYFSYHDIHVPRVPHPRFVGKSIMGPRGDAIAQMDWCTGEVMNLLEELGIEKNTLIIFASDNGPVLDDGYKDRAVELVGNHKPAGPFRGGKYSAFEGGTRTPLIINWPNVIKPGQCDAMVSQIDFLTSLSKLVGQDLPENQAVDSKDFLKTFLGKSNKGRKVLIEEGWHTGIRKGNWKYIRGTWKNKAQLYNLNEDIGEKKNLVDEFPQKTAEMEALFKSELLSEN